MDFQVEALEEALQSLGAVLEQRHTPYGLLGAWVRIGESADPDVCGWSCHGESFSCEGGRQRRGFPATLTSLLPG